MALSFRDKQILLYEGGYLTNYTMTVTGDGRVVLDADDLEMNNLREDFLEAAKTMDKEIEAGNFITVDKQFVMNNVGMFRGIHDAGGFDDEVHEVYVFNFDFNVDDHRGTHDLSLVFFLDTPVEHLKRWIGTGLTPLVSFTHQYSDDWQFVPSLKDWGDPILNWTPRQLIQMIEKFARPSES